jgi:hypothetical protein
LESPLAEDVFVQVVDPCAIRHDLELLHRGRDYAALGSVSALRQRSP